MSRCGKCKRMMDEDRLVRAFTSLELFICRDEIDCKRARACRLCQSEGREGVVHQMAAMLYSDSHIPHEKSLPVLIAALAADGLVPTVYEMECLTMGGPVMSVIDDAHPDTEGEGNPEVDARFPALARAIEGLF